MTIRMDEGAAELLDTLHRAGYAAYVVGGCVRDSLLGLTPHDWDLCTSALPQQVMELFGEINRGGMTVILVTHEADVAAKAQRTIRLRDGKVETELVARAS